MQPENESADQGRSFIETRRRAQIVRAAVETIASIGYAKASFVQIAQRAGISPGLITYHFAKREALMKEVMLTVDASMERALEARVEGSTSYVEALRALIEGFVHYCGEHPDELVAVGQIASASRDAESAREWADRKHESTLDELADMFREGQEAGEFRSFEPRVMAVAVLAGMEATPAELMTRPDTDVASYAAELAEVFAKTVIRPA
jgi:AcrR family transcriptional regulator